MCEYFKKFDAYRMEKRSKISIMDSIIRNNNELTDSEIDVLLRGYIVLIYAFWEGSYKKLSQVFYEFFKENEINKLPYGIKNSVLLELSTNRKDKKCKLEEIRDYRKIIDINNNIREYLDKILNKCPNFELTQKFFKEETGNPNLDKLKDFMNKYQISIDKLIYNLIIDKNFCDDFRKRLDFIITARNNIAHGNENERMHDGYQKYIIKNFMNNERDSIEDISIFLTETVFYIDLVFITCCNAFKDKYMHIK